MKANEYFNSALATIRGLVLRHMAKKRGKVIGWRFKGAFVEWDGNILTAKEAIKSLHQTKEFIRNNLNLYDDKLDSIEFKIDANQKLKWDRSII